MGSISEISPFSSLGIKSPTGGRNRGALTRKAGQIAKTKEIGNKMAKHIQGPRRTLVCALSAWLVFAAFGSHSLKAQGTAAVISGTVTDASGAVVGDAAARPRISDRPQRKPS
jgi:hypothetical protein